MVAVYVKESMRRTKRRKDGTVTMLPSPRSLTVATVLTSTIFLLSVALTTNFTLLRASERMLSEQTSLAAFRQPPQNQQHVFKPTRKEGAGRQMVWLMSFPNSGTSFTSRLVRDATKTVSASNYADETPTGKQGIKELVYPDKPQGPFWIKPEASPDFVEPTKYILTKTHCGIRCTMCPPEKYAESTYSFRRNCFKTKWIDVQSTNNTKTRVFGSYEPDDLAKTVHLIRDPFDNVVSRYHLERQLPGRKAAEYPESREGFREYCKAIDSLHSTNEKRALFLDNEILEIMKIVPCHADFFRYIEWHNLAFVTTRDLEVEAFVLHYDWYTTRYEQVAKELLAFLELDIHKDGELTPFVPGKVYPYFTAEEKLAVKRAFRIMASPQCWRHVEGYFDDISMDVNEASMVATSMNEPPLLVSAVRSVSGPPPLDTLVIDGSETAINGDVQFLMDFAIVGYPKSATSSVVRWLAQQPEISMYDYEIYHLKDGQPADMVRKLYSLPDGIRGYKAPRDIHNPKAIDSFAKYWPETKLVIGLRHPVTWFESFYNYRTRFGFDLPPAEQLIGKCTSTANNVCTEEISYHDHLSLLGKTPRTDPAELALLSPVPKVRRQQPTLKNHIFLYEISQMHDPNEQFREDLRSYLGMKQMISPLEEPEESHGDRHPNEIDICEERYVDLRKELMKIARNSSAWIRTFFLKSSDVHTSNQVEFDALLEKWDTDPCETRTAKASVATATA
jgi:Sulfotransferase domain